MTTVEPTVRSHAVDLVGQFTDELNDFVNAKIPVTLSNAEYASITSALMIALNRQLARVAATFGEVHEINADQIDMLVRNQFIRNYAICLEAIAGQGRLVQ